MMFTRSITTLWIINAFLVIGAVAALLYRTGLAELSERTQGDEIHCTSLSEQIHSLRQIAPTKQPSGYSQEQSLSKMRQSLASCGIQDSAVADIRINGRVAIPKTDYLREDTQVSLRNLDLLTFMRFISTEESQLHGPICSSIDLRFIDSFSSRSTPKNQKSNTSQEQKSDRWDVQLTLTHLIELSPSDLKRKNK